MSLVYEIETLEKLKDMHTTQRRFGVFFVVFTLLVILPTCVVLVASALAPYIILGGLAEGMKQATEEAQKQGFPRSKNFKN